MKRYFVLLAVFLFAFGVQARTGNLIGDAALLEMAKVTLKAHGGEKLSKAKTMILRGSADVSAPGTSQTLPASFAIVLSGEKYRFDIQSAFFNFLQVSDGVNTSTSMPGISLPPLNLIGLNILPKIEEAGFTVSVLPEKLKKKKGFRVTSPEGYYSDFIIDDKTNLVKEYESSYEIDGRTVATAVAISKYKDVDGVLITEKFSQRIDIGSISAYATFNAKDILLNSEVSDEVFTIK